MFFTKSQNKKGYIGLISVLYNTIDRDDNIREHTYHLRYGVWNSLKERIDIPQFHLADIWEPRGRILKGMSLGGEITSPFTEFHFF